MGRLHSLFFWLCIGFDLSLVRAEELRITFWMEPVQRAEFDTDLAVVLKDLEAMHLDTSIIDSVVLTHDDEKQAIGDFCEILSNVGSSVIMDLSHKHWQQGYQLVHAHDIAYVRLDSILRPFLDMFGDFMRKKRANNVVMIFQNSRDTAEAMQRLVNGYPFRTLILDGSISHPQNFVDRIKSLRPAPTYYAMFARGANMNKLFERVNNASLFKRPAEWHFVFLDTRDRVFKYKRQAELATRFTLNARSICRSLEMKDIYCGSGFTLGRGLLLSVLRSLLITAQIIDRFPEPVYVDCNSSAEITNVNAENSLWLDNVHWDKFVIIIPATGDPYGADSSLQKKVDENLENLPPLLNFMANISAGYYSNEHEAKTDLAIWFAGDLKLLNETLTPARRFFRIGTAESVPWSYYRRHPDSGELILTKSGLPIWEGYCIDFIKRLSEKLNFAYEIVAPKHGHMGERNELGEWDGVVGDLVSGETEIAIAALKMYTEREEVIDFLPPYFDQTGISIAIRKPIRRTSLFKFMSVLRLEVWLSILAALTSTAFMLWFLDRFSPYSSRNNRDAYSYECRRFTLRECFWFSLTSFTPQGGGEAPKAISGRVLVAAYWLFVVLMLATFTANLAAFLTVERMQMPVQSLEQLARQSRINYTVVQNSDTHHYFMNMKFAEDTLYQMWKELALNATKDFHKFRIWDYPIKEQYGHILLAINSSKPVLNAREGFANVVSHLNADYAFIHDSAEIKYEVTRNCNLTEVGEVFAEQPYALAVQQGSHLGDELSYAILELQKDRFFEQLKVKYWNQSNKQNCPNDDLEGITLESLGGVFIATIFGLILAMITLAFEVVYYKKKRKAEVEITQVMPLNLDDSSKNAWLDEKDISTFGDLTPSKIIANVTPPPSFEAATFRDRITLGGGPFRPRGREHVHSRRDFGKSLKEAPPYIGYME